ncbi:MAG: GNAT family N-acetyltransferase [Chitinophagales bacterium]
MLIQRKQTNNRGIFYAENDGEVQAEMSYHMTSPTNMVIEHTDVDDELRGQNVGYQLVQAAVEYARQHKLKITVWCPFAKKVFDKNPDWSDVLNK